LNNAVPGEFAFTSDGGKTHLTGTTLSAWAQAAAAEAGLADFQAKQIRSGVETLLASASVSSDIRGDSSHMASPAFRTGTTTPTSTCPKSVKLWKN
jgi:hypothetical protein